MYFCFDIIVNASNYHLCIARITCITFVDFQKPSLGFTEYPSHRFSIDPQLVASFS